jgi:ribosomal protein S27E
MIEGEWDITKGAIKNFIHAVIQNIKKSKTMSKQKKPKTVTAHGKKIKAFDTPSTQLLCEKCGTTNYIYSDDKQPYLCDTCGTELDPPNQIQTDNTKAGYKYSLFSFPCSLFSFPFPLLSFPFPPTQTDSTKAGYKTINSEQLAISSEQFF